RELLTAQISRVSATSLLLDADTKLCLYAAPARMSLLFRPRHNTAAQISLFVVAAGALGGIGGLMVYARTPYARGMQDPVAQPIQFDHRHHTRDEGIDCRYCHNTVDKSPSANIPPTQLCLNCHSQIWNKSPLLEPVR